MKAYALDLRERVVKFIQGGGSKAGAARHFDLARSSVYRYLAAAQKGALTPKKSWGYWRKLDPQKLQAHVKKHPDATLKELQQVFGVSHHAVWVRLGQLGFTLKKTHKISRAQRGATPALPPRTGKVRRPARLLSGRVRRVSPPVS
jgi:transposase